MDNYVTLCDKCGKPIYEDDYFYKLPSDDPLCGTHMHVCEDCILKYRKDAGEWWNINR